MLLRSLLVLAACFIAVDRVKADDRDTTFELKIRPVLAAKCVKCHGATKVSGGLRLDSREAILKGGDNGPAIVPGHPEQSLLVDAIAHKEDSFKMPPNQKLPSPIQTDLVNWVADGAHWPALGKSAGVIASQKHWAFEPIEVELPGSNSDAWGSGSLDRLIEARRKENGLHAVEQADRRTLIRRAYFDLIGLPPDPQRVEKFVSDTRDDAFARLIDELLASPRYGERWGRYWLDLARYADTAGDNSDYPIREAYRYRDYVINAFNADLPYDRFLHEQIAGDILAEQGPRDDYARRVVATGFIAQAKRFGTTKLEDTHQIIEDTLNTTGQVVLGLSLRCARCHDHKFEPITMQDYYGLYGFFAGTKYPFAGAEEDRKPSEFAPLVPAEQVQLLEQRHAQKLAALKAEVADLSKKSRLPDDLDFKVAQAEWLRDAADLGMRERRQSAVAILKAERSKARTQTETRLKTLQSDLAKLEKASPLEGIPVAYAVHEGTATDARIQKGGNPRSLGALVRRGVPKVLDPQANLTLPQKGSGRLVLARWLTESPARALTARVMVNRIWQHHFGKPIVPTPSDFGLRGLPPSHPELINLLARDFINSGWSIKAMHRQIMLSKTYQLSSVHDQANFDRDSGGKYFWRFDRRSLDAEALRDSLLAFGGNLELDSPGPHPFPSVEKWRYTAHHQFKAVYPSNHRSVYLMVQRLHPHPYLTLFNGPDASASTAVRDESSIPLQALFLLNSPFVHDQARRFATNLIQAESDPSARLRLAYLRAYSRQPTAAEQTRAMTFLARYAQTCETAAAETEAWSSLTRLLLASNEFIYVD